MRYEQAVTAVFADRPLRAVCLYDERSTPTSIRHIVRAVHTIDGDSSSDGDEVPSPVSYELRPPRPPDLILTDTPPRDVRAAISSLYAGSVSRPALADIVLVASELTTTALVHGTPPSEVLVWKDGPVCVLQVNDAPTLQSTHHMPISGRTLAEVMAASGSGQSDPAR